VAGRSYGTRLGLAYARAHADRVRSLLIDSVYAPNVSSPKRNLALPGQAIAKLTAACDAQPACLAANGHVDQQLTKAIAAFDARPESTEAIINVDGKSITRHFTLTGSDLAGGLFAAQYQSALVPLLPSIIAALARGDRSIVPTFLSTGVPNLLSMSEGVFYSFECEDSGRTFGPKGFQQMREDPGRNALYALGTAEPFCAAWKVPDVAASFQQPVTVDVPTLVVGGTLDPITPFAESKAQAERMPKARFLAVPGAGPRDLANNDCTRSARDAFWDDPSTALPACVAQLRAPAFAT
jgi:pimeloyl-ACP methyl ester carboxylesterase